MTEVQQIVTMVFGAAVAMAGIALMLFGRSVSSRNHVKVLGLEFEISTPALAVFLVGSALFVLPHFLPHADISQSQPSALAEPEFSPTAESARDPQRVPGQRPTRIPEVVAILKRLDDGGGLLTLELEFVNESTVPPSSREFISLGGAKLLDERSKTSWRARHYGGQFNTQNLRGGERATIWAKFDVAPSRPEFLTLDANFLESPWENLRPNWVAKAPK
jgi:hypothetical protein